MSKLQKCMDGDVGVKRQVEQRKDAPSASRMIFESTLDLQMVNVDLIDHIRRAAIHQTALSSLATL